MDWRNHTGHAVRSVVAVMAAKQKSKKTAEMARKSLRAGGGQDMGAQRPKLIDEISNGTKGGRCDSSLFPVQRGLSRRASFRSALSEKEHEQSTALHSARMLAWTIDGSTSYAAIALHPSPLAALLRSSC